MGLVGVLLVVLWLFQIVYLDEFYKYVKKQDLQEAMAQLTEALKEDDPASAIQSIAKEKELSVKIAGSDGVEYYSEEYTQSSVLQNLTQEQLVMYYDRVAKDGGTVEFHSGSNRTKREKQEKPEEDKKPPSKPSQKPDATSSGIKEENGTHSDSQKPDIPPEGGERPIEEHLQNDLSGGLESMVYARLVEFQDEQVLMLVMVNLTPVDAIVQTLRVQLIYMSVIILLLSLVLSLLISKSVSKSIVKVNESAKEFAEGNFEVVFDGRDYREISQLSDTLNYAAAELAKADNLQRELIANVSHDLRTPLTMIIAYAEVMRDLPGENTPENVQVVIEEAQRLSNLVTDLLDISKLQAGVMKLELREYDLTDSINGVMERYIKLKEQEQFQISFEYDRHVMVCADEYKIFQVLYNLINNAINYTGEDKKVVVRQLVKGDKVRIEVQDTGAGIPKEELGNVWERYYKVDKVHKRAISGTGLGLSICKNILKLHNAEYGVESELNSGSTFWFELSQCTDQKGEA